jgi:D-alanyl-lipoteichoic acid acyltransferase DltB (MBOAT superfamily)
MLFNSISFLLFFPVVTALYFLLPHRWRWSLLLAASSAFYMAFVPAYILILLFTIVVDYFAGRLLESAQGRRRVVYLTASLIANIGVLAFFKYYDFLALNISALNALLGLQVDLPLLQILLPIGLSFHTFQAMSYTIEVYRGQQKAERHFGIYALYVMFYPQLVAGPIERPQNLLHQFREEHRFDYQRVTDGLKQMALGMFKKVVIADHLATEVNRVYDDPSQYHGLALIVATIFFSFQIFYDFSGYSDIARGSAQVMGFTLMKNFDNPYASSSMSEFWRRWHISLSTWFRDYLYIPLGGSRTSAGRRCINLMIVFVVSGLWHGANWTYVVWGALHGVYLVFGVATQPLRRRLGFARKNAASVVVVFALAALAWVFFRANNVSDAFYVVSHMTTGLGGDLEALLSGAGFQGFTSGAVFYRLLAIGVMLYLERVDATHGIFRLTGRLPGFLRFSIYFFLVYSCVFMGLFGATQQFIYFQF